MIIYDKDGSEIKCDYSQIDQMLESGFFLEKPESAKKEKVAEEVKEVIKKPRKTTKPKKDIIL